MSESDKLFAAFLAGFEASGEGFNGEYVGQRFRGKDGVESPEFLERMRPKFQEWLSELEAA